MVGSMLRYTTGEKVKLIFACAWCSKDTYPALDDDEEYTHGVCDRHLRFLLSSLKERKSKMREDKYDIADH